MQEQTEEKLLSNRLWWLIFFCLFVIILHLGFFYTPLPLKNPINGIGVSSVFQLFSIKVLPHSFGLAWIPQLCEIILISFLLSLPLLLSSYKKRLGIFSAIFVGILFLFDLFIQFYLTATALGSEGGLIYLALPSALLSMLIIFFIPVVIPLLIQKYVSLRNTLSIIIASVFVVFEIVAVLFLFIVLIYSSRLASAVTSQNKGACAKMEQVTQLVRPWRTLLRNNCQLGINEQLPFGQIPEQRFQSAVNNCEIQKYFVASSGLGTMCLDDRSAYVIPRGADRFEDVRKSYQAQSLADYSKHDKCNYLAIDFRFGDTEENYLKEMQKICISPIKSN